MGLPQLPYDLSGQQRLGRERRSEIAAACLQDHKRAVIMGERSYGKGSVQNIAPFEPTNGEIKLTTATFWRPSNKNLNKASIKDYDKMPKEELEKLDWASAWIRAALKSTATSI